MTRIVGVVLLLLSGCSSKSPALIEDPIEAGEPEAAAGSDSSMIAPSICEMRGVHCNAIDDGTGKLVWCGSCPTGLMCGQLGPDGGPALSGFCGCDGVSSEMACLKQPVGTSGMQTNGCPGAFSRVYDCDRCGWPNYETSPGSGKCTACVDKGTSSFCAADTNVDGGAPHEADCPKGVAPANSIACDRLGASSVTDFWCCP